MRIGCRAVLQSAERTGDDLSLIALGEHRQSIDGWNYPQRIEGAPRLGAVLNSSLPEAIEGIGVNECHN